MPADSADAFTILERESVLSPMVAERMRRMVGFRNVAVHEHRRLDPAVVRSVVGQGATVLAAAHDLALACALADDAWVLRDGSTAAIGPADAVLTPAGASGLLGVAIAPARGGSGGPLLAPDYRATIRAR